MTRRNFTRIGLTAAGWLTTTGLAPFGMDERQFPSPARRIPKTDTHMHLFNLEQLSYPWLQNAPAIHRNFLPSDFVEAARKSNVGKIVFMESGAVIEDSRKEIEWVIEQAALDPRIKGIVAKGRILSGGAIDPPVEELLDTGWVKGIRGATDADLLASSDFVRAMKRLAEKNLSFDLLLRPPQFQAAAEAIGKAKSTIFILDHLGNPDIKGNDFESWKRGIDELAERPNVNCKISGLITKAGPDWTLETIKPYVYHAIERFGFDRIVYGGDWPVVLLAGSYRSWSRAFEKLTRSFSKEELHKLYHLNADRIYRLEE
jgi:L-fuconolactonase